jgi:hypothetical protein
MIVNDNTAHQQMFPNTSCRESSDCELQGLGCFGLGISAQSVFIAAYNAELLLPVKAAATH